MAIDHNFDAEKMHGILVRRAVRETLNEYESQNPNLSPEDRVLALLWIKGFKVVPYGDMS